MATPPPQTCLSSQFPVPVKVPPSVQLLKPVALAWSSAPCARGPTASQSPGTPHSFTCRAPLRANHLGPRPPSCSGAHGSSLGSLQQPPNQQAQPMPLRGCQSGLPKSDLMSRPYHKACGGPSLLQDKAHPPQCSTRALQPCLPHPPVTHRCRCCWKTPGSSLNASVTPPS